MISRALDAVDDKIRVEEARRYTLGTLFYTLLHDLMTGKRRVADSTLPEAAGAA